MKYAKRALIGLALIYTFNIAVGIGLFFYGLEGDFDYVFGGRALAAYSFMLSWLTCALVFVMAIDNETKGSTDNNIAAFVLLAYNLFYSLGFFTGHTGWLLALIKDILNIIFYIYLLMAIAKTYRTKHLLGLGYFLGAVVFIGVSLSFLIQSPKFISVRDGVLLVACILIIASILHVVFIFLAIQENIRQEKNEKLIETKTDYTS